MIALVMGVSGVGKSTVGAPVAARLGWIFAEGDDFHPQANVDKMHASIPLTDADRWPWLDAIVAQMDAWRAAGQSGVVACSALRRVYRERLVAGHDDVRFVHLAAPEDEVRERMRQRHGHFMPVDLLDSQFDALEPPGEDEPAPVLTLDAMQPADVLVDEAVEWLRAESGAPVDGAR